MSAEIIVDGFAAIKEGWLSKQSEHFKIWRRRWFVLTRQHLYSFKRQGDLRNPTEAIRLVECSSVESADEDTGTKNTFRVVTLEREFDLIAENSVDTESWIGHIGHHMVRPCVISDDLEHNHHSQMQAWRSWDSVFASTTTGSESPGDQDCGPEADNQDDPGTSQKETTTSISRVTTTTTSPETEDRDISQHSIMVAAHGLVPTALASEVPMSAQDGVDSLELWHIWLTVACQLSCWQPVPEAFPQDSWIRQKCS